MTAGRNDAVTTLVRVLKKAVDGFAAVLEVEEISSRAWTSVTFSGARHRLRLRLEGAEAGPAALKLSRLDEDELELRGHVLADLVVAVEEEAGDEVHLGIEALTVEADWL